MEKSRKSNWSKEVEYTLIEAIQSAGDLLRGTGHCADLNKKERLKTQCFLYIYFCVLGYFQFKEFFFHVFKRNWDPSIDVI